MTEPQLPVDRTPPRRVPATLVWIHIYHVITRQSWHDRKEGRGLRRLGQFRQPVNQAFVPKQATMASRTRSLSRDRYRDHSRSLTPLSDRSRSPVRRHTYDSRSPSRSRSPTPRRNGRQRSGSRSRSRGRSASPAIRSTKIVVERLTKNINEAHLEEIFGQFGHIKDLDLPINRTRQYLSSQGRLERPPNGSLLHEADIPSPPDGTNRGTAYILYDTEADAEDAIAHMHEAQLDGAVINVSIVLPRRKMSPAPPAARRGGGSDARGGRGGRAQGGFHGGGGGGPGPFGQNGPRRGASPPQGRFGPRSDTYRPRSLSRSPSRSPVAAPPSRGGGGSRYRSRSRSYSRSPSPPPRRGGGARGNDRNRRRRSPSRDSYDSYDSRRSRSPSRSRDRGGRGGGGGGGGRGYR
ncbi:RNA recognition domain-containing protein [Colletotrichum filicis]|nr:RNA recognition domain-containing protein [Colletotrichum filicis]